MKEYHGARMAGREELDGLDFPSEVQLAIDDLARSMREGLLALSVGVGLKVMNELIEEELTQLVGPKGKNDRAHGSHWEAGGLTEPASTEKSPSRCSYCDAQLDEVLRPPGAPSRRAPYRRRLLQRHDMPTGPGRRPVAIAGRLAQPASASRSSWRARPQRTTERRWPR